jgi:hypothetical protein
MLYVMRRCKYVMYLQIANWLLVIVWGTLWIMQIAQMCYACAWEVAHEKRLPVSKFSKAAIKRLNTSTVNTPAMSMRAPGSASASFAASSGFMTPRMAAPAQGPRGGPIYAAPGQPHYGQPMQRMAPPAFMNTSMQQPMAPPPSYAMGQLMPRMAPPSNGNYSYVPGEATSEV